MYRTSEEPAHRTATIDIARPRSWWAGITFGLLFGLVGLGMLFSVSSWSRFTCSRDDAGKGSCVYLRHSPIGEEATRWDVARLRMARADGRVLVVVFDASERRMFDDDRATHDTQEARARRVGEFVRDDSQHALRIDDGADGGMQTFAALVALFGAAILFGANAMYPARRLLLDEASGTARFEHRAWWLRWIEDETMAIGEVAAIERRIASYEPERDDALLELKAFLG